MTPETMTILVPLERNPASDAEYNAINRLALELGCNVIGTMACDHSPTMYFEPATLDVDPVEEDRRFLQTLMEKQGKRFRAAFAKNASVEWRSEIDWPTEFAVREARAADLIVLPARRSGGLRLIEPGALVLKAGRPVLFLREAGLDLPGRMLIAWKDAREARRAVHDSLPLLKRARDVRIVEILEDEESRSAKKRVADVAAWLAKHGITAAPETVPGGKDIIETFDAVARGWRADLIIAGGYGHSRLGEWMFGGLTRHLIERAPCSVLLSH